MVFAFIKQVSRFYVQTFGFFLFRIVTMFSTISISMISCLFMIKNNHIMFNTMWSSVYITNRQLPNTQKHANNTPVFNVLLPALLDISKGIIHLIRMQHFLENSHFLPTYTQMYVWNAWKSYSEENTKVNFVRLAWTLQKKRENKSNHVSVMPLSLSKWKAIANWLKRILLLIDWRKSNTRVEDGQHK